jgi:hypothetical protein
MIALTGKEEADLREFWEHLDEKPPLVGVLREAVRVFLVQRAKDPHSKKEWVKQWHKKYPPFTIIR